MSAHPRPCRAVRLVALGLAGALLIAACGSSDDTGSGADDVPTTEEAFPVTLEHKYGDTTIDEEPERIAVVGLTEQDALLALGVVPVGTTEWFGEHPGAVWPWAQDELEALDAETPTVMADATAVNFEKVAAVQPDLILALYSDISESDYEKLSQIAPTIAPPADSTAFGVPWDELTRTVGQAVGKADEADALVEELEAEFAEAVAAHPEFEGASSIMATPYEGIYVYGPDDARGRFLTALGFALPATLAEVTGEEFGGDLSEEHLDLLDVDAIVWLDVPDDDAGALSVVYAALAVHQEAREVFLNSFDTTLGGATSFVTALSLPYLLDGVVPMLAAAVDGDPATVVPPVEE